jgi:putative SOS response-associated peptidase YedK
LLQKIPHHRSPVILEPGKEKRWLSDNTELTDITALLHPYPGEKMNAYPISPAIKNPRNNDKKLLMPVGEPIEKEEDGKITSTLELQGMGNPRKR